MTNIWGFLIQTIEVSFIAVLLLIIKRLLKDKLSPRWQYGIWSLLLVCMIMPAGYFGCYILPVVNICLETLKTMIEQGLSSHYIQAYELISNTSFIPYIISKPYSITDYLFIIYIIGVMICILRYIISYIRLKQILQKGEHPHQQVYEQLYNIKSQYHIKQTCSIVIIKSFPSAFIFGIHHPILVLPDEKVDDKIILHELLHLQYHDSLHNVIWSIFKCLHWCNPFLYYVFNRIQNDMESLCDQRVLEHLDGEERREYGRILLSMTNNQYPHAFGTTSLSNGGKNIKARIEAIARFKLYPQGMSLVSICIGILIFPVAISGVSAVKYIDLSGEKHENFSNQLSYVSARMVRCKTIAGAIDLYAKGLFTNNELYLTTLIPQADYKDQRKILDRRPKNINSYGFSDLYQVACLKQISSELYEAYLVFASYDKDTDFNVLPDQFSYYIIPIQILEENGFKVRQSEEVIIGKAQRKTGTLLDIPELPAKKIVQKTKNGELQILIQRSQTVNNLISIPEYNYSTFDKEPKLYAEFDVDKDIIDARYISHKKMKMKKYTGIEIGNVNDDNGKIEDSLNKEDVTYSTFNGMSNECSYSFDITDANTRVNVDVFHITSKHNQYYMRLWENRKIIDEIIIDAGE